MFQHLRNEEAEWCSFDPSYPEDVGLEEGSMIEEAELVMKANGEHLIYVYQRLCLKDW
jgi:hypothetical protein